MSLIEYLIEQYGVEACGRINNYCGHMVSNDGFCGGGRVDYDAFAAKRKKNGRSGRDDNPGLH